MANIILLIVGIVLMYWGFKLRLNVKRIGKNGISADAVVFDTVQSTTINSLAKYPIIRFVTSEDKWITEKYNISTVPGLLKKGQKISVVYNPDNPKEFFVKSAVTTLAPMFVIILGIVIVASGLYKILHIQF